MGCSMGLVWLSDENGVLWPGMGEVLFLANNFMSILT
jgi:hypothetical protein